MAYDDELNLNTSSTCSLSRTCSSCGSSSSSSSGITCLIAYCTTSECIAKQEAIDIAVVLLTCYTSDSIASG